MQGNRAANRQVTAFFFSLSLSFPPFSVSSFLAPPLIFSPFPFAAIFPVLSPRHPFPDGSRWLESSCVTLRCTEQDMLGPIATPTVTGSCRLLLCWSATESIRTPTHLALASRFMVGWWGEHLTGDLHLEPTYRISFPSFAASACHAVPSLLFFQMEGIG